MAKIDDLTRQVGDAKLRRELEAAVAELKQRTRFGLVYQTHLPELTALPGLPITEGAAVVRRERLSARHAFRVCALADGVATLEPVAGGPVQCAPVGELVALQRAGEPIYPGLECVGSVERGGAGRGHHVVINGENYHVLKTLTWTHRGKVDAIYIDPPYNTGARDWKYNNDYVESDNLYRHSKWLVMMERRLRVAKELLNPADSVLIVTIDEKEYLRLGLLLEQMFPEARIQMVSSQINPAVVAKTNGFGRADEYLFFVMFGSAGPQRVTLDREWVSAKGRTHTGSVRWDLLRRSGTNASRADRPGLFYPIYIDPAGPRIGAIGTPIPVGTSEPEKIEGLMALLPIRSNGSEGNWQWYPATLKARMAQGRVKIGGNANRGFTVYILKDGEFEKVTGGEFTLTGYDDNGSLNVQEREIDTVLATPGTQWRLSSHDATQYGTRLLSHFLPNRKFPFPKSLYAVEDTLRFFVANKPDAVILDFFAGSGTTAHAVMRLNKQDGGRRQCISVTNNEVGADEAKALREKGLRPGDADWERWGICDYITRPRIEAAITGRTPDGQPIQGDYKFTDEFPMADGFPENVTFFRLHYLDPDRVDMGERYAAIAPLLWLDAGAVGAWEGGADDTERRKVGFSLPPGGRYAVLFRESKFALFREALGERPDITHVALVTNSEDAYTQMRAALPPNITTRRLYRDYLRSFRLKDAAGTEAAR